MPLALANRFVVGRKGAHQFGSANGQMYPASFTRSVRDGFAALQKHIRSNTDVFYFLANLSLALRRIFLMPQTHP